MPRKPNDAKVGTTETTEKKERKPRQKKAKCVILKVHPKYPELMQFYHAGNWVLIDPTSNWKTSVAFTDCVIGDIANAMAENASWLKVIPEQAVDSFDAASWLASINTQSITVTHTAKPFQRDINLTGSSVNLDAIEKIVKNNDADVDASVTTEM